ncbi:MAG: S9 family peptidase, partial [Hyphomicrobium denitrificans]|nr:S9 family peptidase [Hyphomicrobium denitrificans]
MTAPIASASPDQVPANEQVCPPLARREPVTAIHHGITLTDDYAWLRAANWQEVMRKPETLAADIRTYLEAENAYTDVKLVDTKALQETLFLEMKARLKED